MTAQDLAIVIAAATSGLVAILAALGALYAKITAVQRTINGRVDELVATTRTAAHAAGKAEAAAEAVDKQA